MVDGEPKNVLRAGWKYLHRIPVGIYLSGGLNGFTDFKGTNGISPEISWGLFSFKEVFTVFARYRFSTNFQKTNYSTISIGLASWFFSVQQ
jgi:hypothetical protein